MIRETELRAELADLRRQHDAAASHITELLAAGENTAPARRDVSELARRISDTELAISDAVAEREAEAEEAIVAEATVIAAAAIDRVVARLAALQPPEHP